MGSVKKDFRTPVTLTKVLVYNIAQNAVGPVGQDSCQENSCIYIAHVKPSNSQDSFLKRVRENDQEKNLGSSASLLHPENHTFLEQMERNLSCWNPLLWIHGRIDA